MSAIGSDLMLILLTFCICGYKFAVITKIFVPKPGCKDQILHDFERYSTFDSRNNLDCAIHCSKDVKCISYNYLKDTRNCHLNRGIIDDNCRNSQFHPNSFHFQKTEYTCLHEGTWNSATSTCSCVGGYLGKNCERLMTDCEEGESHYSGLQNFFFLFPQKAPEPFEIRCTMMWGGRTIIMQHNNKTVSFNRSWQEYKDGFSDNTKDNFWLGLDKLHYLTESSRKKVYVEVKYPTNIREYHRNIYDNFKLGNESTGYRLISLGSKTTDEMSDCLPDLEGSKFSAFDKDQDGNSQNCAAVYGAGFWYDSIECSKCNLFGQLNSPLGGTWNSNKSFAHWPGNNWSPFATKIWIRNYS